MDSPNRLSQITITPTVARQTPRNEFGAVLADAVGNGLSTVAGIATAVVGGQPVAAIAGVTQILAGGGQPTQPLMSAAVSGHTHAASPVAGPLPPVTSSGGSVSGTGSSSSGASGSGNSAMDLLEAQRAMQQEGYAFQAQYLKLQDDMQRESREFNTITNIMKVRHDSAKAAISNIR